uniref:Ig-like domain-containing protein n=1 Tax=Cyprinus carpio TaxID=7962 RepID=A0A8C1Z143_CYPCA
MSKLLLLCISLLLIFKKNICSLLDATKTISLSISPSAEMQTDAPKNIAVSISPIVEGESVTHKHGEKYSDAVPLNVMYPPKNVSVYINGSGETEGDSVTLICSSDSNPPALNFSWFKEDQISSVGSGQSFSALQSGRFYCEAHNQHGSQRSDAVTVTVKEHHGSRWHEVFGITVECGVSFIIVTITIIIIMFIISLNPVKTHTDFLNSTPRPLICTAHSQPFIPDLLKTHAQQFYNEIDELHLVCLHVIACSDQKKDVAVRGGAQRSQS